jgi:flagella basal body P-ring formation protein FlgA
MLLIVSLNLDANANEMPAGMVSLSFEKNVEVPGDTIFLEDMASIIGDDESLVQTIKKISIGKSPLPGKTRRFDRKDIEIKLKNNDIDLSKVTMNGTEETDVIRGSTTVTVEQIEEIVFTELPEILNMRDNEIFIKNVKASNALILPKGEFDYTVVPAKNTDSSSKMLVSVLFNMDGKFTKKVYATVEVERYVDVVVAQRSLQKNQIINETDFEVKKMNSGDLPESYISNVEDVLGNKVKRNLEKGNILRTEFIEIPPVIKRNDVVLMVAESNNFKIVTLGEAQEKGFKGDRIKVVNLESKNEVYAWVIDSKSVRVGF